MEKGTSTVKMPLSSVSHNLQGWSSSPVRDSNPWRWVRSVGILLIYHALTRSNLTKRMLKQSVYKLGLGIRQPATALLRAYLIHPRLLITRCSTLVLDTNKIAHLLSSALSWLTYSYWRWNREKWRCGKFQTYVTCHTQDKTIWY